MAAPFFYVLEDSCLSLSVQKVFHEEEMGW